MITILNIPMYEETKVEIVQDDRSILERWFGYHPDKIRKIRITGRTNQMSDLIVRADPPLTLGEKFTFIANRTAYIGVLPYEAFNDIFRCRVDKVVPR